MDDISREIEENGQAILSKISSYRSEGFEIVLSLPARLPTKSAQSANEILERLRVLSGFYDTIVFSSPDLRSSALHLDDKAVSPNEFVSLTYDDLRVFLGVP